MGARGRLESGPLVVPQTPGGLLLIRGGPGPPAQDSPRFRGTAPFLQEESSHILMSLLLRSLRDYSEIIPFRVSGIVICNY